MRESFPRILKTFIAGMILAVTIQGCLPRFTQDDLKRLKRVAVISLASETLRGVNQGTTIFQHVEFSADLRAWTLNQFTEDVSRELFRSCSDLEVVNLSKEERSIFSRFQIVEVTLLNDKGAFGGIKGEIMQLAEAHGLDLIMLILDYSYTTPGRYQKLQGYSLHTSTFLGAGGIDLYAIQEVRLLDLYQRRAVNRLPFLKNLGDDELSLNFWVDPEMIKWKDSFEQYTKEEKSRLMSILKRKIRSQVKEAISEMGLINPDRQACGIS